MSGTKWPKEIAEADATGEVKEIYEEIKDVLGVAMVNLLYRRLAVEPAALKWTWGAIRGAARAGELERGGLALAAPLASLRGPGLPIATLRCVGIDDAAQAEIDRVIMAFNYANPRNLIGTCIWAILLEGKARGHYSQPLLSNRDTRGQRANVGSLPPMISIDQMDANTAAVVQGFLKWRDPAETPSVPSLYRHLAHWPAFLALALAALSPLFSTGVLGATQRAVRSAAMATAEDILARSVPAALRLPDGKALATIKDIASVYPTRISELVVVGHAMSAMLRPGNFA